MMRIVDQNGAALFLEQSHYPDPTDPQEVILLAGSAEEGVWQARPIVFRMGKAEAIALRDALAEIIERGMNVPMGSEER